MVGELCGRWSRAGDKKLANREPDCGNDRAVAEATISKRKGEGSRIRRALLGANESCGACELRTPVSSGYKLPYYGHFTLQGFCNAE